MINIENLTAGLNAEQRQAVLNDIDSCTKVVAGAGTGKTTIISKRYTKLVQDLLNQNIENPIERILVITFTDKAAIQMKEKIFAQLRDNNINYFGQTDEISTIHSFCSKILRTHAIEAKLSPYFKLANERELSEIYATIIEKIKRGEYFTFKNINDISDYLGCSSDVLKIENLSELTSVASLDLLFNEQIFYIIKQIKSLGLSPKEFLDKTIEATEKFSKVVQNLPLDTSESRDFHISNWELMLKHYFTKYEDFEITFDKILDEKQLIKINRHRKDSSFWTFADNFPECVSEFNNLEIYLTKVIAFIYAIYQNILEENDLADFDDLINKTIEILQSNEVIRTYYQKHFKHIIIDEFQDTNGAQLKLLTCLLPSKAPNITMVGDKKQSIYGFRFARMENLDILQNIIEEKYKEKYSDIKLKNNYRSVPQILDVVNYVTKNELNLDEEIVSPKKDVYDDAIKISVIDTRDDSRAVIKNNEIKYIAEQIIKYKKEKNLVYSDFAILVKKNWQADDIEKEFLKWGIPCFKKVNTNFFTKPVIKNIISVFKFLQNIHNELEFVRILRIKFSDKDIFDLKKDVYNLTKGEDFKKYNLVERIIFLTENKTFANTLCSNEIIEFVNKLFDLIFFINKNRKVLSLRGIFDEITTRISFYNNLSEMEKQLSNIDIYTFREIINDYAKTQNFVSIKNFNEYIDAIKDDKQIELPSINPEKIDAVNILTIHSSKGLEFPYVFVAGIDTDIDKERDTSSIAYEMNFEQNILYGLMIKELVDVKNPKYALYKILLKQERAKAEKLRLFYVALSRAQNYLNVISYTDEGKVKPVFYVKNLQDTFIQAVETINPDNIKLEKQHLHIPFFEKREVILPELIRQKSLLQDSNNIFFSFSKIHTFNNCQNEFVLQYKYGFPKFENKNQASLRGSIIHNLIYLSLLNKRVLSKVEIDNYLKNTKLSMNELALIFKIYENFVKSECIRFLNLNNLQEYGFNFVYNNANFRGDIDLIVFNDDETINIIDFKTNKEIEKSLQDYIKQMFIYKKAMENEKFVVKDLIILNINEEEYREIKVDEISLNEAELSLNQDIEKITGMANASLSKEFFSEKCENCGYNYICRNNIHL